ncbi:MAG: FAD-dependent oxidoreductase [Bdellovibrionales bacterium]
MKLTSSFLNRPKHLKASKGKTFDLLVVGGGITGAGVARDAAMRGLSVCLVERGDFGEGTSSRSSKLAHGGLRYLENLEFDLVSEALHERQNLLSMASHMVKPLRFLMPIYKEDRVSPLKMKMGMLLYDVLAAFNVPKFHESVSARKIKEDYPNIKSDNLRSGFLYSDALMDDDRLVHETLRSAVKEGAVVLNYVEGGDYEVNKNGECSLTCEDKLTGEKFRVLARHTVSSVGPWTDQFAAQVNNEWEPRMRPSKGVHITLPKDKLNLKTAVVMAADKQNRILFCIPREGFDIVGTTDTDFVEDPSLVRAEKKDVDYILNILKEYYPNTSVGYEDILFTYAGVRPLVNDGSESESKVSRSHWIKTYTEDKVTYISGGKYTTFLAMAEDCVDKVVQATSLGKKANKKSDSRKVLVELNTEENNALALKRFVKSELIDWPEDVRVSFVKRHGAQAVSFIKEWPGLRVEELEAKIAIHYYFCAALKDFYFRRVPYLLKGVSCLKDTLSTVGAVFEEDLGLNDEQFSAQLESLEKAVNFEEFWRDSTY